MNKELIKWLLFVCGFFCVCFWADIKLSNAIIAFLACLLGGFCYDRIQKDIAQKVADKLEKKQQEKE